MKKYSFYLFFLLIIFGSVYRLVRYERLYLPVDDFYTLQTLDVQQFKSITLGLEPYRGVMLAANLLGTVKLYSIEDSYFPKVKYDPQKISKEAPLLTTVDSCYSNCANQFKKLTNKLILIFESQKIERNVFYFNKKEACNGIKIKILGLSNIEEWGAWSDGETTVFEIEVMESYPVGGKFIMDVRPVINTHNSKDARFVHVSVDSAYSKSFRFNSVEPATLEIDFDKKEPGSKIVVMINHINPIKLSDISGSDPRRVSLGFLKAKLISKSG
jgi:hypothetical protein